MAFTVNNTPISVSGSSSFANIQNAFAGIISAYDNPNSKANLQRDSIQQSLIDKANLEEQDLYNQINSLPGTPHDTLDKNIKNFFMNKLDKGYEYEVARQSGQISSREANMMLSDLNTDMDTYVNLAPQIMAQAEIMKTAISNGSISRANSDPMQMMFIGIAENAGNIKLEEDEGGMYLVGSGEINGKPWEGKVNIKDVQNYLATEGAQIARTIPSSEDMGLGTIFSGLKDKGKLNEYMTTKIEKDPNNPGYTRTVQEFTPEGILGLRNHLMQNTQLFETLMRSDMGASAWADVANHSLSAEELNGTATVNINGVDETKEGWGVWNPNDKEKVMFMREKLIDRMLAENLPTKTMGALKADQYALARYKASLDNNKLKSLSAGAKTALFHKQKIDAAWRAGDIESLDQMVPGVKVVKQDNGNFVITSTKTVQDKDGGGTKQVISTLFDGKLNLSDAQGFDQLYDIFKVTPYGAELGLDAESLTGYSPTVYSEGFKGIGTKVESYMKNNPTASVEEILKVKPQVLKDNKLVDDPEGKTMKDALSEYGITITDGDLLAIDFESNPYLKPLAVETMGKTLDKNLLKDVIDYINNNQIIMEKQDQEKRKVILENVKRNKPS